MLPCDPVHLSHKQHVIFFKLFFFNLDYAKQTCKITTCLCYSVPILDTWQVQKRLFVHKLTELSRLRQKRLLSKGGSVYWVCCFSQVWEILRFFWPIWRDHSPLHLTHTPTHRKELSTSLTHLTIWLHCRTQANSEQILGEALTSSPGNPGSPAEPGFPRSPSSPFKLTLFYSTDILYSYYNLIK